MPHKSLFSWSFFCRFPSQGWDERAKRMIWFEKRCIIADKDTLVSVIDGNQEKVNKAVEELENKKIIKYMRQYGYYDFFDSSIFDLEAMIEEIKKHVY